MKKPAKKSRDVNQIANLVVGPADLPAHLRRMLTASGNFSPASVPRPKPPELGV